MYINLMNHYTYQVEDKTTGEFYLGVRSCKGEPIKDRYMGSMKAWKPNKDNLWKRVLATYPTRKEANAAERELIQTWIEHPWNRNAYIPGVGFCTYGVKLSDEHGAKVSAGLKGKRKSPEHIKAVAAARNYGPLSDEIKKQISDKLKGHTRTEESRLLQSLATKGKLKSEETKQRMRKPKAKVECPHCGLLGGGSRMVTYHFDNCKNKP